MKRIITTLLCALLISNTGFAQVGVLDSTFAENGILNWDVSGGNAENGHGLAVQKDGKIVVAVSSGLAPSNNFEIAVVRLNQDGSIDSTFAENGIYQLVNDTASDLVYHLELLDDESIMVAGGYGIAASNTDFVLVKLSKDGVPDASFGTDGVVTYPVGTGQDYAHDIVIDKQGKIIVGGYSHMVNNSKSQNVLSRLGANGMIDSTFGTNGIFLWGDTLISNRIWHIEIADDGNILACGKSRPFGSNRPAVFKILEDGSGLDSTFATNGEILAPYEGEARDMIIHSNGNILVTGSNSTVNGGDLIVLAYNQDGTPSTDFGFNGVFVLNAAANDYGHSLIEQPDGKILVAGESGGPLFSGSAIAFFSARMNENGVLDTSWGEEGYVRTETSTWMAWAHEVALQPDGKVLLAGTSAFDVNNLTVCRYGNYIDADQDGYELNDDCDDFNAAVNPGMEEMPYNGLDDDCNAATPDDDLDMDGYVFIDDCDETNPDINPGAEEIPDNDIDEDCDGMDLVPVLEASLSGEFLLYPNPTNDRVFIKYDPNVFEVEFIEINDYTGRKLKVINSGIFSKTAIDLLGLPSGLLILTFHTAQGVGVKRIVKK